MQDIETLLGSKIRNIMVWNHSPQTEIGVREARANASIGSNTEQYDIGDSLHGETGKSEADERQEDANAHEE